MDLGNHVEALQQESLFETGPCEKPGTHLEDNTRCQCNPGEVPETEDGGGGRGGRAASGNGPPPSTGKLGTG